MQRATGVLCLLIVGCGSSSDNGPGAGPSDSGTPDVLGPVDAPVDVATNDDASEGGGSGYPAPHSPMPQAVSLGGPVMTAPKIVGITFAGDTLAPNIADFVTKTGAATAYWAGTTSEYGVGPIASATTVNLNITPAANLTDADVRTFLQGEFAAAADGGTGIPDAGPPLPLPDANTQYVLFYPSGITVTDGSGATSCQAFGGYHDDFPYQGGYVTYAIVPRCPPPAPGVTEIDAIAATASHEMIEAATDPQATDHAAYQNVDTDHLAWATLGGSEIGDLCAAFPDSFYKPTDLPYLVQRVWSNQAAAASHDPCEPNGSSPYFNAAPLLGDTITVGAARFGTIQTSKGVKIPVGQSKAVELDLYSDGPTSGPWSLQAIDIDGTFFGGSPELSFTFDKTSGQNGDKVELTIKVLAAGQGNVEPFWLQSTLGNVDTVWVGFVGN